MPETMTKVEAAISRLNADGITRFSLLVVPGRSWQPHQITRLQDWFAGGAEPVAHGWSHHTQPRKWSHRLHAALISRNVAEHLALNGSGILDLMKKSKDWFQQNGLPEPDSYVPPAWALGPLSEAQIQAIPFRCVEVTRGILLPGKSNPYRLLPLPLCGFEADNLTRQIFLSQWNQLQLRKAKKTSRPLRISIHPNDFELRCRHQLERFLALDWEPLHFTDLTPACTP